MDEKRRKADRLSERTIQIVSIGSLGGLVYVDRILHLIQPPVNDYWYGMLFFIGFFGTDTAKELIKIIKISKLGDTNDTNTKTK